MSQPAIIVENLSKKFQLGTTGGPAYHRLSEALSGVPKALGRSLFGSSKVNQASEAQTGTTAPYRKTGDFWALKEISFEVEPGEVVGIVGSNGAGKSTLLKILSRITEPTSGRFGIRGRVASLLEVGTGFHPELTGRENIYVSGVTLGMTRAEVRRRFDEIVEFSGIETFLDTPVKRYSSGMQVRLGFAVAAHLESEILIVDEVLAVGDTEFQKRCLGKMSDVTRGGQAVLLVSHNPQAILSLADKTILLKQGHLAAIGEPARILEQYQEAGAKIGETSLADRVDRTGSGVARFTRFSVASGSSPHAHPASGQQVHFYFTVESLKSLDADISFGINDANGIRIAHLGSELSERNAIHLREGANLVTVSLETLPLTPGQYSLTLYLSEYGNVLDWVIDGAGFTVAPSDFFGTGRLPASGKGPLLISHRITSKKAERVGTT